ncbi:MAG TPA: YHS domain-containing protein [Isosphaeraceae bacterium]|nr:YHS domain-containing protein [Isosphaeraceae bacterium]
MAQDPVCGMDVQPEPAAGRSEYQGQRYSFCGANCHPQFDPEPRRHATSQPVMTVKS